MTVTAKRPRGKFDAIVLPGSRLLDAPVWVRLFSATRIVVPDAADGLLWAGGLTPDAIDKAALAVGQLAEGQTVGQRRVSSGWMVVVYVAAALFATEMILTLVALIVSSFVR